MTALSALSSFAITQKWPARHPDRLQLYSLPVLDQRLAGHSWIMGDSYTIADIATFPWVRNLIGFYEAGDIVGITDFSHVTRALAAFVARPAVVKGLAIPARS
jgi:GSH-dependent disulfide-bond oxidoreductase